MSDLHADRDRSEKAHPEELIDRALRSELREAEWKILRQHLSTCSPCAAHLQIAGAVDGRTARATGAAASSAKDTQLNWLAAHRVLQRLEGSRRGVHVFAPRRWIQIAVGLALLSGTATAASWWAVRRTPAVVTAGSIGPIAIRPSRAAGTLSRRAQAAAVVASTASVPDAAPAIIPAPGTGDQLAAEQLVRDRPRGRDGTRSFPPAAALLQQARRMRMEGDDAGAGATYLRLQQLHPRSSESHLSHVLLGRLYLESRHEQWAAREFAAYLSVGGGAAEEALVGRATALARLGHSGEEAETWSTLLLEYPRSVYAARARARLATSSAGEHPHSSTPNGR